MALVPQELFVIRDTKHNKIMQGAKGQYAFDTSGSARKSLVHTGWWGNFKTDCGYTALTPHSGALVDAMRQLVAERDTLSWDDPQVKQIQGEITRIQDDLKVLRRANYDKYDEVVKKTKFDKQKRYAVELLVNIETKEIK